MKEASNQYCKNIAFGSHTLSWFDDIGHVRGHFNLWISNYMQYYLRE